MLYIEMEDDEFALSALFRCCDADFEQAYWRDDVPDECVSILGNPFNAKKVSTDFNIAIRAFKQYCENGTIPPDIINFRDPVFQGVLQRWLYEKCGKANGIEDKGM